MWFKFLRDLREYQGVITLKAFVFALVLAMGICGAALAEDYGILPSNAQAFGDLLLNLMIAYERPAEGDAAAVESAIEAISAADPDDGAIARAIADHCNRVYLSDYELYVYGGEEVATALAATGFEDSPTHAIVVLGYKLKDGEMTEELVGRCDAAAAAAKYWPSAIILCSGGATGKNNPLMHTEAGMMKDYLVNARGIDAGRIFIDESAMTTLQNAENTFEMMRERDIRTMTVVTSTYHQRWGQAIYNAMSAIYRQSAGYSVEIVGNYCFDIAPADHYKHDDRFAIRQLAALLERPDEVIEDMKLRF